ncbi:MAG TPA: hypothetical protein PLF16_00545 [Candidatus Staskawiczbacteria bacterium]|nr:hypothetical protein [Candidatus Staskawiczbacteria bacterium]
MENPQSQQAPVQQPSLQPQFQSRQDLQQNYEKPKSHFLLIFLFTIILLAAIAGGAVFALNYFDPEWNPLRPSPEQVILQAWENQKAITSQKFDLNLSIDGSQIEDYMKDVTINLSAQGGGDWSDRENLKHQITGSLSAYATDEAGRQYKIMLAAESRYLDKQLFVKLGPLNLGGLEQLLMMFGLDVSKLEDQWIRFRMEEAAKDVGQMYGVPLAEQTENEKYYREAVEKIVRLLLDKKVYDISQLPDIAGDEGIEYHYGISLNKEKLIAALPEIYDILAEYRDKISSLENAPEKQDFIDESTKGVTELFDKYGPFEFEISIGKKDRFFRSIQINKTLDGTQDKLGILKIDFSHRNSAINQPLDVQVPTNYVDFETLMTSYINELYNRTDQSEIIHTTTK